MSNNNSRYPELIFPVVLQKIAWGIACVLILLLNQLTSSAEEQTTQALPVEAPITDEDRDHWSFKPIVRPDLPAVKNKAWVRNPIDHFILNKLETAELRPMTTADRITLIRRLCFDLTGLPPTPKQVNQFLADQSPDAYQQLVDRLLASSDYGIRWGQHWLDLARFAETDGFEHDKVRPNAWKYRDWVVDAFNTDVPYDEFVRKQLAGDVLYPDDPTAAIATGFLLCGPDMPDINLQNERRHTFLNDMTATVGSTLLAMQIGCAQCHDHKYDPISQADFYRLRAYFDPMDIFREHSLGTHAEKIQWATWEDKQGKRLKQLQSEQKVLEAAVLKRVRSDQNKPQLKLEKQQLTDFYTDQERNQFTTLTKQLEALIKQRPGKLPLGRVVQENSSNRPPSYLWIKGDFRRKGPEVTPAFVRIATLSNKQSHEQNHVASGRVDLADWILSSDNPLTTRVIVNRLWQHHFGSGLSTSPSDFGIMGDHPTHPRLLDWLATELPRQKWSLKAMHRLMVNSATYRQASLPQADKLRWNHSLKSDPNNKLFSRMNRRRLEGEAIRDAMLFASQSLTSQQGGPGIRPPLSEELLSTLLKNQWQVSVNEEDHRRRSLYLFVRRNFRYPIFDVFDRPDTNQSCPERNRSTTALQSLMMLNSEFSLTAARRLAGFILNQAPNNPEEQIRLCFQRTLSRIPTESELNDSLQFLKTVSNRLISEPRTTHNISQPIPVIESTNPFQDAALVDFCLAVFNLNEFVYID